MRKKFREYYDVFTEISFAVSEAGTSDFDNEYLSIALEMDKLKGSSNKERDRLRSSMLNLVTKLKIGMEFPIQKKLKRPFRFDATFIKKIKRVGFIVYLIAFFTLALGGFVLIFIGIMGWHRG